MPNIEIHGFGYQSLVYGTHVTSGAKDLGNKALRLLSEKSYLPEVVITICADEVFDVIGKPQPFLRVVSTPTPHLDEIVELLKTLNVDIEVQMLSAFYPKKP